MTALYTATGTPAAQTRGTSAAQRNEFLLIQAAFAMLPSLIAQFGGSANYAVDTGAANAYAVTENAAIAAYTDGLEIVFKAANANTGASTVTVNALGPVAIVRANGAPLVVNDIFAGQFVSCRYNATTGTFIYADNAMGAALAAQSAAIAAAASNAAAQIATAQFQTVLPGQSALTAGLFPQSQGASGAVNWASATPDYLLQVQGII
jgi:hypothetical protein